MKTVNADSFPFKGKVRMGMGLYLAKKLPILTPALPLKGRELFGEVIS
jgi:hypothetical protein